MRARSAIALCLVSTLSLSPTAPTLAAPAKSTKKAAAPRKPLRGPLDIVMDMAGGLLKSVAGSAVKELLFPSKTIDTEKLLADISANVRKEIVKTILDGDDARLTSAATALKDYETEWKNGAVAATIEDRVERNSSINFVGEIIARTGPTGKREYVEPSLPLFVAAAQLKANRLELRRQLVPSQDESVRAVLIEHLEFSLAHVKKTMNERRADGMYKRLGQISDCGVTQKRTHGLPWDLITTYETGWNDSGVQQRMPGSQADNDEGKALARCDGNRQPYFDRIRKGRAPEVDPSWTGTENVLDTWAQTLDVLKRHQAPVTARFKRIDFGGMFGAGEGGVFVNAVTGTAGCPAGYTPYEFKGTINVDWPAYYCGRIGGVSEPVADFGGMYGLTNDAEPSGNRWINNAITGGPSCPAGFTAAKVRNQHELYYCWKRHEAGKPSPYQFGGLYSDNGQKNNPITERTLCPIGYSPALVHGTRGGGGVAATREVIMCWMKTPG